MTSLEKRLEGKRALVMGGSRGIGAAIVRRLADDGAAVAFTYSASEKASLTLRDELTSLGSRVLAIKADSAIPAEIQNAVASAADGLGGLDILVNNAGILIRGGIDKVSIDDIDRTYAVNIRAVVIAVQAAAARMGADGRIVVIGSAAADKVNYPGASIYAMSKAAVAGLVRGLAIDLAPRNITVNTVQPGPTASELNSPSDSARADIIRSRVPLARQGQPSEIAAMVAFAVSPDASFVTGSTLTADGGYGA